MTDHLSPCVQEFASLAASSSCPCGNRLLRRRQEEAVFFTLSRGMVTSNLPQMFCLLRSVRSAPECSLVHSLADAGLQSLNAVTFKFPRRAMLEYL